MGVLLTELLGFENLSSFLQTCTPCQKETHSPQLTSWKKKKEKKLEAWRTASAQKVS